MSGVDCDLLLVETSEVLTLERPGLTGPRRRKDLAEIGRIERGVVGIRAGNIVYVGPEGEAARATHLLPGGRTISCERGSVLPGFVDSHTHLPFAGWRHEEFEMRLQGKTYQDIARAGGGIRSSMRATRAAREEDLARATRRRLDQLLLQGTTTVEAKSGYGLSVEDELKQLRALRTAAEGHPVEVVPTFLGAHEFPPEFDNDHAGYIRLLVETMIPEVARQGLAEYADVFCEVGVYSPDEARSVLDAALRVGLTPRLHADEFAPSGAAELAAALGAASADHLSAISEEGIEALADSPTIGTILPGTTFSLRIPPAKARRLVDAGIALAVATDFNPGSSALDSMPVIIGLACIHSGLLPAEAVVAATLNAAHALHRADRLGSVAPGKQADLVVLHAPDYRHLAYRFGSPAVQKVIKLGKVVVDQGRLL